eukprot:1195766-Prorocentrum_minimum.AAC.2
MEEEQMRAWSSAGGRGVVTPKAPSGELDDAARQLKHWRHLSAPLLGLTSLTQPHDLDAY